MNNKDSGFDFDFLFLVLVAAVVFIAVYFHEASAKEVRTVHLSSTEIAKIKVTPGRSTVLSFPTKPTKVIVGSPSAFAVEYVDQDIVIAALRLAAVSNLFVYAEGRRFAFDLTSVPIGGDELVFVRDRAEKRPVKKYSDE